ncbi:thrombospondin type-1 domain-containing protein 7A isoform X2 [Drosophila guanche]|nr:thrombospondin type-1 domain-containing protein 7A isoform X2 [Drosophila guanche]
MKAIPHTTYPWLMLLLAATMPLPRATGGSCREAQLCCNGRDSSCVVQKDPVNAIIENLSDKPCYCDHACLKLGDCCDDFKDHCGVLDCQASDWSAWSECNKSCGSGLMTRSRQVLQVAQNGGKHCPTLFQTRSCQGFCCHGHHEKKILREMALLLPAALSHNVSSSATRRNLRRGYRGTYRQDWDHDVTLNEIKPPIGYTKVEDLCTGFTYKTNGCKLKKTSFGTKKHPLDAKGAWNFTSYI